MNQQPDWQVSFDFLDHKPVVVEPQQAQLTSDAGLLPIRQLDERLGMTAQFTEALDDPRLPRASTHSFLEMVRMRVYGILTDYPDQNDHDVLRHDPLFKLLVDRSPESNGFARKTDHYGPGTRFVFGGGACRARFSPPKTKSLPPCSETALTLPPLCRMQATWASVSKPSSFNRPPDGLSTTRLRVPSASGNSTTVRVGSESSTRTPAASGRAAPGA